MQGIELKSRREFLAHDMTMPILAFVPWVGGVKNPVLC